MTRWLTAHVRTLVFAFALLALAGIGAAVKMPVSLFPHIDFPRVVVSVDAGDRAADQMAIQVTRPLEEALRGVPGVAHIRSTTSRGSSEIALTFDWGHDMVSATLQAPPTMQGPTPAAAVRRSTAAVAEALGR